MAIGDDAAAAGYPLVPPSGDAGEVRLGYQEINRTRDFIALVKNSVLATWPVSRGGTGATSPGNARNNLGIYQGTANASDGVAAGVDGTIYFKILT